MKRADPQKPVTVQVPVSAATGGNTTAFIFGSILFIIAVGSAAIVAISLLRPGEDNTVLITSVIGFLAPTLAALLALIKSAQTGAAVQELHLAVNSRLTELLDQTAKASKSEGREEKGREVSKKPARTTEEYAAPLPRAGAAHTDAADAAEIAEAASATVDAAVETVDAATSTVDVAVKKLAQAKKKIPKAK